MKHYGSTATENNAVDALKCHKIVRTIIDFGVNEQQKLKVIYLLALELENREHMQDIATLVKRCESGEHKKSTLITDVE